MCIYSRREIYAELWCLLFIISIAGYEDILVGMYCTITLFNICSFFEMTRVVYRICSVEYLVYGPGREVILRVESC